MRLIAVAIVLAAAAVSGQPRRHPHIGSDARPTQLEEFSNDQAASEASTLASDLNIADALAPIGGTGRSLTQCEWPQESASVMCNGQACGGVQLPGGLSSAIPGLHAIHDQGPACINALQQAKDLLCGLKGYDGQAWQHRQDYGGGYQCCEPMRLSMLMTVVSLSIALRLPAIREDRTQ